MTSAARFQASTGLVTPLYIDPMDEHVQAAMGQVEPSFTAPRLGARDAAVDQAGVTTERFAKEVP